MKTIPHRIHAGRRDRRARRQGFTLIEVLVGMAITAMLMLAMTNVVRISAAARAETALRDALAQDAHFAMNRMVRTLQSTSRLLVPLAENPITIFSESVFVPGVLAVPMPAQIDRDLDGFADADNDRDGRVDEDLPRDTTNDNAPGVYRVDDNHEGIQDLSFGGSGDDDETGFGSNEDPINGIDDDGDGTIDEDPPADMNGDGAPGIAGADDDGDGSVDEGIPADDDEDGLIDEDWYDPVVYSLSFGGTDLVERFPVLGAATSRNYTERVIAEDVSLFRVERLPLDTRRVEVIALTLTLARDGLDFTLQRSVRVGVAQ